MQDDKNLWYLENIDLTGIFCPGKQKAGKMDDMLHHSYKKGEYVYLPDDQADRIYLLVEGKVKIGSYSSDGKEITKTILEKGEVFGEMAAFEEGLKRRDFALVLEDVNMCVMTRGEMAGMMREYSPLTYFMMKLIARRKMKLEKRLESMVFKDSKTRIIDFLLELAEEKGQDVGFETVVRGMLTHQEIANLTATSRQTVTTVLNDLRNKDLITFNRRRLLYRDLEGLANF